MVLITNCMYNLNHKLKKDTFSTLVELQNYFIMLFMLKLQLITTTTNNNNNNIYTIPTLKCLEIQSLKQENYNVIFEITCTINIIYN